MFQYEIFTIPNKLSTCNHIPGVRAKVQERPGRIQGKVGGLSADR